VKYVVLYESSADFRSKVPAHVDAHRALWQTYRSQGKLLLIGPFTDEPAGGALAVFTSRAAAEEFVASDPFVKHGVVTQWKIREWHEVLGE
jgi:uncharacterized protein YciI